jgi:hypothetical protein
MSDFMQFRSKPEAMSYALMKLSLMQKKDKENKAILTCSERIKIAFEKHEQNTNVLCLYLTELLPFISNEDIKQVKSLIKRIQSSDFRQSLQEKFENPLGRRFESELFSGLFLNPTEAMMHAVNRISIEILKTINKENNIVKKFLDAFTLTESRTILSCGAFKEAPTIEHIEDILKTNSPKQFAEILYIHLIFVQHISRGIPIEAPSREPVGKLAHILKNLPADLKAKDHKEFFEGIKEKDQRAQSLRCYISDVLFYQSPLFTYLPGKGRQGSLQLEESTQCLSLMRRSQAEYNVGLPIRKDNHWIPDCIGHSPDFLSPYVLDAINNNAIYISGPSGMTSMLLGQMEFIANLEDVRLKQCYLSAAVAYIVGPGFHSLHEVIGPAQYCLGLVPGYPVHVPEKDKPIAPRYDIYFQQQMALDPEFSKRRDIAWERYLHFFENDYLPIQASKLKAKIFSQLQKNVESKKFSEDKEEIIEEPLEPAQAIPLSPEKLRLLKENRERIFTDYYRRLTAKFWRHPEKAKKIAEDMEKRSSIFQDWKTRNNI